MRTCTILTAVIGALFLVFSGCGKDEPEPSAYKPREAPKLEPVAPVAPAQPSTPAAPAPVVATPRPAVSPVSTQPAATAPAAPQAENDNLQLTPPEGWKEQPPEKLARRPFIKQLFGLPKVEGDIEDAEVTVSSLTMKVPLQQNINRWCGQFEMPAGTICTDSAKQRLLPDTKYRTIIVELAGAYIGMLGAAAPPKPGYRMIAAEITTDTKPWYLKLVGPEKTVAHWEKDFLEFVHSAK